MSSTYRPTAAFAMRPGLASALFDAKDRARLHQLVDIDLSRTWDPSGSQSLAQNIEVLITGWGAPTIDAHSLRKLPRLRAIFHTGGSVQGFADDELWQRGIRVTTAAEANAVPVSQFTAAMIVLALKDAMTTARRYASDHVPYSMPDEISSPGVWGSTVGIIGASRTGRRVIAQLHPLGCRLLVADPFLSDTDADALGVERVDLDELFEQSDVVTIHAPDLPSTRGLVSARLLARLRRGATLINTARPALVNQEALLAELRTGRITAMLDVTDPEPLPPNHELLALPNVVVTPHLAGAHGRELTLLGANVLDELERFVADRDALAPVRREEIEVRA